MKEEESECEPRALFDFHRVDVPLFLIALEFGDKLYFGGFACVELGLVSKVIVILRVALDLSSQDYSL